MDHSSGTGGESWRVEAPPFLPGTCTSPPKLKGAHPPPCKGSSLCVRTPLNQSKVSHLVHAKVKGKGKGEPMLMYIL